jgi:peptide/nickel transport system permease protein
MHCFQVITVIFFLFNVLPGDPARMMLDQNENSEQLALIKKKYGFDKPNPVFILYSMTSHRFHCTVKRVRLHVFEAGKYNAAPLFSFSI